MLAAHISARLAKSSNWGIFHRKRSLVTAQNPKGAKTSLLLSVLLIYLIASRVGPVLFRFGSNLNDSLIESCGDCLSEDYRLLIKETLNILKAITKAPGLLITRRSFHSYIVLESFTDTVMGTRNSKSSGEKTSPATNGETNETPPKESSNEPSAHDIDPVQSPSQSLPSHVIDQDGHVRGKKGSVDAAAFDMKRLKESDRNESTQSVPVMNISEHEPIVVKFKDIENSLETGDLALLYRHGQSEPHFAVFINHSHCDKHFPLLFIKGKTKPLELRNFRSDVREVRVITAVTRIFYGDYEKVLIRRLKTKQKIDCQKAMDVAEEVESIPYTQQELMFITDARTPVERSRYMCTFILAHVYHKLGIMLSHPKDITPQNFQDALPLGDPIQIKLPPTKPGPLIHGDPPLLAQIAKGLHPSPQKEAVSYTKIRDSLQTGDIVLFSGATSSGAIIKIFNDALFSHIGIIIRPKYSSHVMVWESSTNKADLVDVDSGSVRKGVELLPLRNKIFSGWYDHVAIRKLTGVTPERRSEMYEKLLEVRNTLQGTPYEKNHIEMILSAIDVDESYLSFLKNHEEDLSSIFCSELVAHAYQEMGLLDKSKLSNEFTPDDFSTNKHNLHMLDGASLEPEVYIELNFDYQKESFRQTSIPASEANKLSKQ